MSVRRARIAWSMLIGGIACLFPLLHASGQSSDSSLSDIGSQLLQGLSSDQRDAITNQFGMSGGGQNQNPGRRPGDEELQQAQQNARRLTPDQKDELDRLSPFLAADDWLVITIDSNPLPAIAAAPNSLQQIGMGTASGVPSSALATLQQNPAALSGIAGVGAANPSLPTQSVPNAPTPGTTGTPAITVTAGGYAPVNSNAPGQPRSDTSSQNAPELSDEQKMDRQKLIELIRSKNPYQLSHDGVLTLPGFAPISLAGLTEQLAMLRIGAEPALQQLFLRVTKLPLRKMGQPSLKPYGYDVFNRQVSTFAPSTNVPVPANYVVGPEDRLEVQLYGRINRMLPMVVGRDGIVQFPDLGPISVGGQTFESAKETIEGRVARQMTGTRANVTMADTRSIRVFVLGEVRTPGTYTVSGLATMTSALFAAGGINKIGSLRAVVLKRQGVLVRRLDLYDMLIRGDTGDDVKLLPGDAIFVPPVGPTVAVDGEVRRPAIYEVRGDTTVENVVQLAGGLTAEADRQKAALTRIDADQRRVVLQVDVSGASAQPVRDGDLLRVPRLRPTLDAGVQVDGYLYSPGSFAYHEGLRLTDVVRSADDLRPNADLHYVLIRRELPPDRHIVVLSADLEAALKAPGSPADIVLMARDKVMAFDLQSSRDRVIRPLLDDLRLQSTSRSPTPVVRVDGRVNVPGEYPLEQDMTVRDLLRAGGSLSDAAYSGKAELTRYTVMNGEARRTELISVDLTAIMRGDPTANIKLQPFDSLSVKQVQAWDDQETVTLVGEVRFPGRYSLKRGETLKSVMMRAGGLTDMAFVEGAVFTRKELRDREQKQLDMFAVHMQDDIAFMALQGANANQTSGPTALMVGQALLEQLRSARAVGRLIINLNSILASPAGSASDVLLHDGDQLIVPKLQQEVSVIGEVQIATSHLYRAGYGRSDYIAMSGGETRRADDARVYVVRADGSVVSKNGGRWFARDSSPIRPGDTVVVPLNAEHLPPLPMWQAITQILYNVAISAAAVHSF